jgi:hypothetical protein
MAIVKTGGGIIDIRGSVAGNYFHRDKSGLHCCRLPRNIRSRSSAQDAQRKAFVAARAYSTDPRVVSYNIYRALNGLPMAQPPLDYQPPGM